MTVFHPSTAGVRPHPAFMDGIGQEQIRWFSAMPMPVLITDATLERPGPTIVYVNPAFEAMSGYAADEVIGRTPRLLQGPGTDTSIFADLPDRLEAEGVWQGRTINYRKGGQPFALESSITPVRSATGQTTHYLAIHRDVTAEEQRREKSEEHEILVSQVLAHATDAVLVVDEGQRIVVANPAVETIFGWPVSRLLGQPLDILLPARLRERHRAWVARFADGEVPAKLMGQRGEITGRRRDGTEFPAEASIFPVRFGTRHVFATILRDVSERKARDAELRESRRRFQALFDLSFQFVGLLSADGRMMEANEGALGFINQNLDSVRGLPLEDTPWFAGNDEARLKVQMAVQKARGGQFVRDELRLNGPDGRQHIFDFSLRPVLGDDGRVQYLIPEGRDITEIAETTDALRRSEQQLSNAQRIANVGNWHWTVATGELHWSDQVYRIFGVDPQSFSASYPSFIGLVHPEDRGVVTGGVQAALAGHRPYDLVHRIIRPDGSIRYVRELAEVTHATDGSPLLMEGVVQDVTKAHEAETQLIEAYNQARDASEAKTQFLATMSHELRTPLNAIIGFSEILQQQAFGPLGDAKYAEYAGHVLDSGRHLLSLVNDVLDISRIAAREFPLTMEDLDPADVIAQALPMIAGRAEAKGLRVIDRIPGDRFPVQADVRALRQILLNGLSNAVKFTPAGGVVWLSARRKGSQVALRIFDSGIGIPRHALPGLGQPFRRVRPAYVSEQEGIGLGLAIVAGLAEQMGGQMRLISREGRGTCLEVRLQAADAP